MNPKITVFMPVYNTEKYLRESIDSILKQTYKNFEFLIIDDGSTDSCVDIIKSYKDNRIVFFRNEENKGLSYTRNRGIYLATGEFIAFMDSDDICKIDRLAVQVKFLEENPEYQIVASNADKLINKKLYVNKNINKKVVNGNIKLMFCCGILNGSVMIKKDFIIKNQIKYKEECFVAEDCQFFIDCTEKGGKIAILPQSLVIYRIGHNSITRKTVEFQSDDRKKLIDKIDI